MIWLTIYGQEKDNATVALAKMNMVLHNNPEAVQDIEQGNTLSSPVHVHKENQSLLKNYELRSKIQCWSAINLNIKGNLLLVWIAMHWMVVKLWTDNCKALLILMRWKRITPYFKYIKV
mgnify:CR=1 FL=1